MQLAVDNAHALAPDSIGNAARRNGSPKPEESKADILLVDDREDKLLAIEAVLESLGQNIVKAHSGKEALRLLLKREFAVILLDVSMPEMDGFETASLIRQRISSEHTPIIFVTSFGDSEKHLSRGYSLGAVDYIITPIVPEILRTKVSVFVELHRKTRLLQEQAEQLRRAELHRFEVELAGVSDRLEAETKRNRFFTLALDMLGIADFNGKLLQLNPSWEKVLGYTPAEFQSMSGPDFVHPEDLAAMAEKLRELRHGNPIPYFEGRYRHKDGSYRWLGWSAAPFVSENLIYIFCRDITARREAEERIVHLNTELEKRIAALTDANAELEAFNYSISHDLRTPLRLMSSFATALLEEQGTTLSPQAGEYARRIINSAKYMDALLRDLLTYSRLSREEITMTPIALEDPVKELLQVLETEISAQNVQVEVCSPLGHAMAHLPTLRQILANLIGNSIKFTAPDRRPIVRLFTTEQDDFLRLWVEDNGIGIRREYLDKIFKLFERLPDARTYPGTGIGLALVRKGAERMGGRAGAESEPGRGSRFWVDLPHLQRIENAK